MAVHSLSRNFQSFFGRLNPGSSFTQNAASQHNTMAMHLVPERQHIVRISPAVGDRYKLDSRDEIQSLTGIGAAEARKALPGLRTLFFEHPVTEEFKPFHF